MEQLVFDERLTRHVTGAIIVETRRGLVGESGYWDTRVTFSPSLFDSDAILSDSKDFAAAPFAQARRTIKTSDAKRMHESYVAAAHAWTKKPIVQVTPGPFGASGCTHSMTRPLHSEGFYDKWCTLCGAVRHVDSMTYASQWHSPESAREHKLDHG